MQVDDLTADFIISQLLFLDAEDSKKDIRLFINSPGGSVTAGMSIVVYYTINLLFYSLFVLKLKIVSKFVNISVKFQACVVAVLELDNHSKSFS